MADEWQSQLKHFVNTIDRLKNYINLTPEEQEVLENNATTWGTTHYFASLMDRDDPNCPIRRQVIPSLKEKENSKAKTTDQTFTIHHLLNKRDRR